MRLARHSFPLGDTRWGLSFDIGRVNASVQCSYGVAARVLVLWWT